MASLQSSSSCIAIPINSSCKETSILKRQSSCVQTALLKNSPSKLKALKLSTLNREYKNERCRFTVVKAEYPDSGTPPNGTVGSSSSTENGTAAGTKKPTVVRRSRSDVTSAEADNLTMRAVEESGISVEGVAKVDRESNFETSSILRIAAMAGGDILFLILFAWIGRASHVSTAVDFELLKTADPFIAGWVVAAYFLGDYFPDKESPKGVGASALSGAKTWAVGVPLGIAIRSFSKGELPPLPFVVVSMVSTLVLVVGWRVLFASTLGKQEANGKSRNGNRQGNPFEFFQLLTSLVRRW